MGTPMAFRDGWVSINGLEHLQELLCNGWGFQRRVGTYVSVDWKLHCQGPLGVTKQLPGEPWHVTKTCFPAHWQTGLWIMISIAFIFRLGQQHFNSKNICCMPFKEEPLWESGWCAVSWHRCWYKGALRAPTPVGVQKEQWQGGTSLISGNKPLNAGRM